MEFLMFLAQQGRVSGSLWDCSSRCCYGEQDPCLPSDVDLFWTDLTLQRTRVLFSPEVANQMKKTYVGHFTLISRKYLGPEL